MGRRPRHGAGRGDRDPIDAALPESALEQGRASGCGSCLPCTPAGCVSCSIPRHGASRPAARRSRRASTETLGGSAGASLCANNHGRGGSFPDAAVSTSNVPPSTAGAKSRTMDRARAGGLPGKVSRCGRHRAPPAHAPTWPCRDGTSRHGDPGLRVPAARPAAGRSHLEAPGLSGRPERRAQAVADS